MKPITEEERQQVVKLYRNPNLTIQEIANIVGLSALSVNHICRAKFADGTLRPRAEWRVGSSCKKKFTDEQLREIAQDYYENKLKAKEAMAKYGLHPMQMQRVRRMFGGEFAPNYKTRVVVQFNKGGEKVAEYPSCMEAATTNGLLTSGITACCQGRYKSSGGFVWKYKDEQAREIQ